MSDVKVEACKGQIENFENFRKTDLFSFAIVMMSFTWMQLSRRNNSTRAEESVWSMEPFAKALRHIRSARRQSRIVSPPHRVAHQASLHTRAKPTRHLLHSLWLHIYIPTDDHRSHAAVLELCPHPTSVFRSAIAHGASASRAEAVSEEHHGHPATASISVAKLVY